MSWLWGGLIGAAVGWGLHAVTRRDGGSPDDSGSSSDPRERLYDLAESLSDTYDRAAQPRDLLEHPDFVQAAKLLAGDDFTQEEVWDYLTGDNQLISTFAAMSLAHRGADEGFEANITSRFNELNFYARDFCLRALDGRESPGQLGRVLGAINDSWDRTFGARALRRYVRRRVALGDAEVGEEIAEGIEADDVKWLAPILRDAGAGAIAETLERVGREQVNVEFLNSFGKVWSSVEAGDLVGDDRMKEAVSQLHGLLTNVETPRSTLLVGPPRVGKTSVLKLLAKQLIDEGWTIFEATAVEIMAGQSYFGEIEQRMQDLMKELAAKPKLLWVVPEFGDLQWAGRHRFNASSLLDMATPFLEAGDAMIFGEISPAAHERLLRAKPALRTLVETVRLEPLGDQATLELAERWAALPDGPDVAVEPDVARESFQLAQQFLGETAQPGGLMDLLELSRQSLASAFAGATVRIELDHVLGTLSRLTGLPRTILDDREGLDLASLQQFFQERVIGQPEAVSCLVERVAMIKAGLTDPSRPMGVFLFTGPTGTGKTEIAKALSSFLFGAADRMIRLDMSEFQHWDSVDRLLGDASEDSEKEALVNQVRKQPFSVLLLDEFEKAHSSVWDLFLQVFDDGRLTDRRGRLADFRHTIVIMTSNLGARAGAGMGFGGSGTGAIGVSSGVEKQLKTAFRPEFLNRIDRVVVFRSLSRGDMRRVLDKELRLVLERRGLRNRSWAVEWDDTAYEFFLDRGYTPELGARPLRRTIERHLLSPLAMTIVNEKAPTGDQFLFVRSDGQGIQVQFVDPDEERTPDKPRALDQEHELDVGAIAFDAQGTRDEVDVLSAVFEDIRRAVDSATWRTRKQACLDAMSEGDFWNDPGRFAVLGRAEYIDRVEVGLDTAGKLMARLGAGPGARQQFPRDVVERAAERLHLMQAALLDVEADRPADAFVSIEPIHDGRAEHADVDAFGERLVRMYRNWASRRGMEHEGLEAPSSGDSVVRWVLGCAGFGAHTLLENETGLHVFEAPGVDGSPQRLRVRVRVAPQPDGPQLDKKAKRREQAHVALRSVAADPTAVVRRYREEPSPLVRDAVKGWRTGRADRVFDGDFDLL